MNNQKYTEKLKLSEKGWNDKELRKAEDILNQETERDLHFSTLVFWSAVLVIIFANLIVSLILIPFLIVLYSWILYLIVILLGLTIGFLYAFLINSSSYFKIKHHLLGGILIPIIALANLIGMVLVANKFIADSKINNLPHDIWIIAIIFTGSLILPYLLVKVGGLMRK